MSATACKTKVPATTLEGRAETRAWLLTVIMTSAGAWTREARELLALAEQCGITLDEKALMNADVRDLQRWQACLCERPQEAEASWRAESPDDGSGREGRGGNGSARRISPHSA